MNEKLRKLVNPHMLSILKEKFEDDLDEVLWIKIEEFLKFIIIISEGRELFIPLTKELDDIWHEFIVQTRSYQELCDQLPGKRFIHHASESLECYVERKGRKEVVTEMLSWLPAYVDKFGPFTEDRACYWTMCLFLQKELGLTLDEINRASLQALEKRVA